MFLKTSICCQSADLSMRWYIRDHVPFTQAVIPNLMSPYYRWFTDHYRLAPSSKQLSLQCWWNQLHLLLPGLRSPAVLEDAAEIQSIWELSSKILTMPAQSHIVRMCRCGCRFKRFWISNSNKPLIRYLTFRINQHVPCYWLGNHKGNIKADKKKLCVFI